MTSSYIPSSDVYSYHTGSQILRFTKDTAPEHGFEYVATRKRRDYFLNTITNKLYFATFHGQLHLYTKIISKGRDYIKLPKTPSDLPVRAIRRIQLYNKPTSKSYTDITILVQGSDGTGFTNHQLIPLLKETLNNLPLPQHNEYDLKFYNKDGVFYPMAKQGKGTFAVSAIESQVKFITPTVLKQKMKIKPVVAKHTIPYFQHDSTGFKCNLCDVKYEKLRQVYKHYQNTHSKSSATSSIKTSFGLQQNNQISSTSMLMPELPEPSGLDTLIIEDSITIKEEPQEELESVEQVKHVTFKDVEKSDLNAEAKVYKPKPIRYNPITLKYENHDSAFKPYEHKNEPPILNIKRKENSILHKVTQDLPDRLLSEYDKYVEQDNAEGLESDLRYDRQGVILWKITNPYINRISPSERVIFDD